MDQHIVSAQAVDDAPPPGARAALSPLRVFLLTLLIILGAVVLCCLVAGLALLALAATQGRDGLADFMTQMQFDMALRTRVGAATFSVLYLGLAAATLLTAKLVSREGWTRLVAWLPIKPGRGRTLMLSIGTLIYAAAMTYTVLSMQDRHFLISGPTDVVLLGTLITNLCVLAPVAEELLFRGWFYTALRSRVAFWPSYLITTFLFAAIHWYASVTHMLKVLPLAVVLGLVREWKGSIKPTIALHGIYNLTIVLITLVET